jgi:hypothetical protein
MREKILSLKNDLSLFHRALTISTQQPASLVPTQTAFRYHVKEQFNGLAEKLTSVVSISPSTALLLSKNLLECVA